MCISSFLDVALLQDDIGLFDWWFQDMQSFKNSDNTVTFKTVLEASLDN